MGTKYAQPLHQIFTGGIEVFVHILESLGRDRFNPHQRALDIRFSHGGENTGSSAASMVIWVKNTMSDGKSDKACINSKRSSRMAVSCCSRCWFPCAAASSRSRCETG